MVALVIATLAFTALGCGTTLDVTAADTEPVEPTPTSTATTPKEATTSETSPTSKTSPTSESLTTGPVTTASLTTASLTTMPDADISPERSPSDHFWYDFTSLQSGRHRIEISADGDVASLIFGLPGTQDLTEVKTSSLDQVEIDQIFSSIERKGFLEMGAKNSDETQTSEADILMVAAELRGRRNVAIFRPPGDVPASIEALVEEVDDLLSDLESVSAPVYYIKAVAITPARLEWLEKSNTSFLTMGEENLSENYPSLATSKASPDRMVELGASEYFALNERASDGTSIFIITPDGPFQFELYSLKL